MRMANKSFRETMSSSAMASGLLAGCLIIITIQSAISLQIKTAENKATTTSWLASTKLQVLSNHHAPPSRANSSNKASKLSFRDATGQPAGTQFDDDDQEPADDALNQEISEKRILQAPAFVSRRIPATVLRLDNRPPDNSTNSTGTPQLELMVEDYDEEEPSANSRSKASRAKGKPPGRRRVQGSSPAPRPAKIPSTNQRNSSLTSELQTSSNDTVNSALVGHLAPSTNEYHLLYPRDQQETSQFQWVHVDKQPTPSWQNLSTSGPSSLLNASFGLPIAPQLNEQKTVMSLRLTSNNAPKQQQTAELPERWTLASASDKHEATTQQLDPLLLASEFKVTSELLVLNETAPFDGLSRKNLTGSVTKGQSTKTATLLMNPKLASELRKRHKIKLQPPSSWLLGQSLALGGRLAPLPATMRPLDLSTERLPDQGQYLLLATPSADGTTEGTTERQLVYTPLAEETTEAAEGVAVVESSLRPSYNSLEESTDEQETYSSSSLAEDRASSATTPMPVDDGAFVSERLATASNDRQTNQRVNQYSGNLRLVPASSMAGIRVVADPRQASNLVLNHHGLITAPKRKTASALKPGVQQVTRKPAQAHAVIIDSGRQQPPRRPAAPTAWNRNQAGSLAPVYEVLELPDSATPFSISNPLRWNSSMSLTGGQAASKSPIPATGQLLTENQAQMVFQDLVVLDEAPEEPNLSMSYPTLAPPMKQTNWVPKQNTSQPHSQLSSGASFHHNPPYNKPHQQQQHVGISPLDSRNDNRTQQTFGPRPTSSPTKRPADRKPPTTSTTSSSSSSIDEPEGYTLPQSSSQQQVHHRPETQASHHDSSLTPSNSTTLTSPLNTLMDHNGGVDLFGGSNSNANQTNQRPVKFRDKLQSLLKGKVNINKLNSSIVSASSGPQAQWATPPTSQPPATPAPLLSSTVANNVASLLAQKLNFLVKPGGSTSGHHNHHYHSPSLSQPAALTLGSLFGIRNGAQQALASNTANKYKNRVNPFVTPPSSHVNRRTAGMGSLLVSGFIYGLSVLPALMALTGVNPLADTPTAATNISPKSQQSVAGQGSDRIAASASTSKQSHVAPPTGSGKKPTGNRDLQRRPAQPRPMISQTLAGGYQNPLAGSYAYLLPMVHGSYAANSYADFSHHQQPLVQMSQFGGQSPAASHQSFMTGRPYGYSSPLAEHLTGGSDLHPVLQELPNLQDSGQQMANAQQVSSQVIPSAPSSLRLAGSLELANERINPYAGNSVADGQFARPAAQMSWSPPAPDRADLANSLDEPEPGSPPEDTDSQALPYWTKTTSTDSRQDLGYLFNNESQFYNMQATGQSMGQQQPAIISSYVDPILTGNSDRISSVMSRPKIKRRNRTTGAKFIGPSRIFNIGYTLNYTPVPSTTESTVMPTSENPGHRSPRNHHQHQQQQVSKNQRHPLGHQLYNNDKQFKQPKFIEFHSVDDLMNSKLPIVSKKASSPETWRPIARPVTRLNDKKFSLNHAPYDIKKSKPKT